MRPKGDATVQGRQVFVYRWGIDAGQWEGDSPTPAYSLNWLKKYARDLDAPNGGLGIGKGSRVPSCAKLVKVGDVLIFYAGSKFGDWRGAYGIAEAGDDNSAVSLVIKRDDYKNEWMLPFRWLKASKVLAHKPFRGYAALFAPAGPASTLLRLTSIPKAVHDLVTRSIKGRPLPDFKELTTKEQGLLDKTIDRMSELSARDRNNVIRSFTQSVRDSRLRRAVLTVWFRDGKSPTCAACGSGISIGADTHEVEIAHVVDKWDNGKDQIRNGIPLCRTHHWAFDNDLWGINPLTLKIVVRKKWGQNALLKKIHGVKVQRPVAVGAIEPLATKELKTRWKRFMQASNT